MSAAPLFDDIAEGPAGGSALWCEAHDGLRIRIALWRAKAEKGTIFVFPGRTEYIEKYGR
jgi:lysophospholipase